MCLYSTFHPEGLVGVIYAIPFCTLRLVATNKQKNSEHHLFVEFPLGILKNTSYVNPTEHESWIIAPPSHLSIFRLRVSQWCSTDYLEKQDPVAFRGWLLNFSACRQNSSERGHFQTACPLQCASSSSSCSCSTLCPRLRLSARPLLNLKEKENK